MTPADKLILSLVCLAVVARIGKVALFLWRDLGED